MAESSRFRALGGVALLWGLGLLIVFGAVLGPGEGLFFRDHHLAFRPQWWAVHTQVWDGAFPALDPTHPGGRPLESSTGFALFTPATLVLLAGPFDLTYDLFVVFHYFILAAGLFTFVRMLGGDVVGAGVTATVGSLCGPVLGFENLVVGLQGVAWSPWLWCGLLHAIRHPGPRSAAGLGFALFLAIQGVMPELVLIDVLVLAGLLVHVRPRPTWRLAAVGATALVLGVAAATPDWVPLIDALATARRGAGFSYEEASGWALGPLQSLDLWVPSFWYAPEVYFVDLPAVLGETPDVPYLLSLYLGSGLLLAVAAPYDRHRALIGLAAVGLLFVVLALGRHTPLHAALVQLPLFSSSRYAVKYLLGASFVVALLSGATVRELDRCARPLFVVALGYLALVACVWGVVALPEFADFLRSEGRPFERVPPFEAYRSLDLVGAVREAMQRGLLHALGSGLAIAAVTGAVVLGRLRTSHGRWLLAVIVVVDLASAGRSAILSMPTKEMELPEPVASALEGGGPAGRPWVYLGAPPPVVDVPGQPPYRDLAAHMATYGRHAFRQLRPFLVDELEGMALDEAQVRFHRAVAAASKAEDWDRLRRLWREAGVAFVLTTPTEGRPGWLADMTRLVDHADEVGRRVEVWRQPARPYLEAVTAWRTSVVPTSTTSAGRFVPSAAEPSTEACESEVHSAEVAWGHIEAEVELGCPGFFTAAEVGHPGWSARMDGVPVPVSRADAGYLAVAVPKGRHEVSLSFHSRALAWVPCMLAALLTMGFLGLWRRASSPGVP